MPARTTPAPLRTLTLTELERARERAHRALTDVLADMSADSPDCPADTIARAIDLAERHEAAQARCDEVEAEVARRMAAHGNLHRTP